MDESALTLRDEPRQGSIWSGDHGAGYTSMQEEEVTGGTLERRSTWLSRNVERWGRRKRWRRRLIGLVNGQIDRSRRDRKRCPFCYLKEWKATFSICRESVYRGL